MSEEKSTTLAELQTSGMDLQRKQVPMSMTTGLGFEQLCRVAKVLNQSTMVPSQYRAFNEKKVNGQMTWVDNPSGLANCIVALNMAVRMNADPLQIMQALYVIEGRPSWSSQFIIASINSCGRYSPLRFDLSEPDGFEEVEYEVTKWVDRRPVSERRIAKVQHRTCRAWVIEKETGDRLDGPPVSVQMAIDEGWLTKNGSKWLTMPEIMLRYRAASFFGRLYAPELLMGLQSREEVEDFIDAAPDSQGHFAVNLSDLQNQPAPSITVQDVDTETGETSAPTKKPRQTKPKPEPVVEPETEEPEQPTMLQDIEEADTSNLPQFD